MKAITLIAFLMGMVGHIFAQSPTFEIIFPRTAAYAINMGDGVYDREGNYYIFQERVLDTIQRLYKILPNGEYTVIDSIQYAEQRSLGSHDAFSMNDTLYFIFENGNNAYCQEKAQKNVCVSIYTYHSTTGIQEYYSFADSLFSVIDYPRVTYNIANELIITYSGYSPKSDQDYRAGATILKNRASSSSVLLTDTLINNGFIAHFMSRLKNGAYLYSIYDNAKYETDYANAFIQLRDSSGSLLKSKLLRMDTEDATIESILIEYPNQKFGVLFNSMYDVDRNTRPPTVDRKLHFFYDLDTATMDFKHKYIVRGIDQDAIEQTFLKTHIRQFKGNNLLFLARRPDLKLVSLMNMDTTGFIRYERQFGQNNRANFFELDIAPDGSIMCAGTYLLDTVTNDRRPYILKLDSLGCLDEWEQCPVFSEGDTVSVRPILAAEDVIEVYPNPTNDILYVQLPAAYIQTASLQLYDMAGKLLRSQVVQMEAERIQMETLPPATYILTLEYAGGRISKQIVKL